MIWHFSVLKAMDGPNRNEDEVTVSFGHLSLLRYITKLNVPFSQINLKLWMVQIEMNVQDEVTVMGFEVPRSPASSYNNPGFQDEDREPPQVPPHLQHTLLSYPPSQDGLSSLPLPQNSNLNHLYIENREGQRSVVALGNTQRFRSKYVTVVIYKPVRRR